MGISVMAGVDPGYLNAGLMKPRRGFTMIAGKEKLGVYKFDERISVFDLTKVQVEQIP